MKSINHSKIEFGDFQTPAWFAKEICKKLTELGFEPAAILEPNCGQGNLLLAALDQFPDSISASGFDINAQYITALNAKILTRPDKSKIRAFEADYFSNDWHKIISTLPAPLLVIGNPPWVTNSQLSTIKSNNLPQKNNFQNYSGIDAITGASNFDISEWMILKMLEWAEYKQVAIAMLCKTSVARRILLHRWKQAEQKGNAKLFLIDSKKIFNASVDACLLIFETISGTTAQSCDVFNNLSEDIPSFRFGYKKKRLIANLQYFERWKHLQNTSKQYAYQWRSGIKHDCSNVMELQKNGEHQFTNNLGETYQLESTYVYPMLKSSDLANNCANRRSRWMLVTQQTVGEKTSFIKNNAPDTWAYLKEHDAYFDKRKSSIYKDRPPFSIFGVGDYTFSTWKVAISGLYKKLNFVVVGPTENKPTVLDDTCYFLSCKSEEEAVLIAKLLDSKAAKQFFQSFIFWDTKRPITAKILNCLNLFSLARELDCLDELRLYKVEPDKVEQLELFDNLPTFG